MQDVVGDDWRKAEIHFISSNTHSVTNLLSPWVRQKAEDLLSWGRENLPHAFEQEWHNESDRLYFILKQVLLCVTFFCPLALSSPRYFACVAQRDECDAVLAREPGEGTGDEGGGREARHLLG